MVLAVLGAPRKQLQGSEGEPDGNSGSAGDRCWESRNGRVCRSLEGPCPVWSLVLVE